MPYESTVHESAHAIDYVVSERLGYSLTTQYNGGWFETLLQRESKAYIDGFREELQTKLGRKVDDDHVYNKLSWKLVEMKDPKATGMLSDILGGATKGEFKGTSGHDKEYWTGGKDKNGKTITGQSVATEAWAHFTSMTTNPHSAKMLKEVFPKSYKEYLEMCDFIGNVL